jgi:hypothetical protein
VAIYSHWPPRGKQTSSKPQVGISIPLQYIQIPASRSHQVRLHLRFGPLPDRV